MRIVYLITVDELKKYMPPINLNVDDGLVKQAILDAQNIRIKKALKHCLYDKIEDLFVSGMSEPENVAYKNLFDNYIYTCLSKWALVELLPYVRYKIHNKGTNTQSSEETATANFDEYKYLYNLLKNKAEDYTIEMDRYIQENITDYPEYINCCDDIRPSKGTYFSGIEFYD